MVTPHISSVVMRLVYTLSTFRSLLKLEVTLLESVDGTGVTAVSSPTDYSWL